jgi:hypothetical protein
MKGTKRLPDVVDQVDQVEADEEYQGEYETVELGPAHSGAHSYNTIVHRNHASYTWDICMEIELTVCELHFTNQDQRLILGQFIYQGKSSGFCSSVTPQISPHFIQSHSSLCIQ